MREDRTTIRVRRESDIAVIEIDNPPVNTSTASLRRQLLAAIGQITASGIRGAVLTGAGKTFMSGSDVREFAGPIAEPELPAVIAAIEQSPTVFVAAIQGPALGGGLELALGCDARIAAHGARLGVPELDWGILPGAGGIQRLVRAIGHERALQMILLSTPLDAVQALDAGLVADVVETDSLLDAAINRARTQQKSVLLDREVGIPGSMDGIASIVEHARRTRGDLPGLRPSVDLVLRVGTGDAHAQLIEERAEFNRLRALPSAGALRHLRLAELGAPKVAGVRGVTGPVVNRIGIVGAGAMGAGIARVCLRAGIDTRIWDLDPERPAAAGEEIGAIAVSDLDEFGDCDLILEAVVEDFSVKRSLFERLDGINPRAILASNTSYLNLDELGAVLEEPGRLVGMHFFNPPEKMSLLEIVRTSRTSLSVLSTALRLSRLFGKTAIVTGVSDGFVANRMFAAYRREMEVILQEGGYVDQVDHALVRAGWKMGPFAVADLSGLDIAWSRRKRLAPTRPSTERFVDIPDRLCELGRLGRKAGAGYYDYASGSSARVDPVVTAVVLESATLAGVVRRPFDEEEIVGRALAALVNEGVHLLEEGIAARAGDLDVAAVLGYGVSRMTGGPLWWSAQRGASVHRRYLDLIESSSGSEFVARPDVDALFERVRRGTES